MSTGGFSLLSHLYSHPEQESIFSEDSTIESWLKVESALARAQAENGVIPEEYGEAIARAAVLENIDRDRLWTSAANVGYPILGLVREISHHLPEGPDGRVHYGATTQDIMDTGLVLQLVRSVDLMIGDVSDLGAALADIVETHALTVMAARTHAQHAVPTTWGATLATLLDEVTRHMARLRELRDRLAVVSMAGAGGTSAAYGPSAAAVREHTANLLGLKDSPVPWHTARDRLAEFGHIYAMVTASCARLARNIIDLSRTEIGEVFEKFDSHRGASSTMPQKVNPISSEAIIGLSQSVAGLASTMSRIQEAGHERAAGEWQLEWEVLPRIAVLSGGCVTEAVDLVRGMRINAVKMLQNLELDYGLLMAEAQMISLAEVTGREKAHDIVYEASVRARQNNQNFRDALLVVLDESGLGHEAASKVKAPHEYLGLAAEITAASLKQWAAVQDTVTA